MRVTHNWLTIEFTYQYLQVLVYILTNCVVMGVMIIQQKKERQTMVEMKGSLQEDTGEKKKSKRLSTILRKRDRQQRRN